MAKKATSKSGSKKKARSSGLVERSGSDRRSGDERRSGEANMGDAFIKLLQRPLAAELVAGAATAALGALWADGFTTGDSRGKRAGKAVKEAGKAAAAAVGR